MKKRFFVAALAAAMFATSALGLAACSKDPATGGEGGLEGDELGGDSGSVYTITLDANGGSFSSGNSTRTQKTSDTGRISKSPDAPSNTPNDKVFYGWGESASATVKLNFPHDFTGNTKIYAIWTDDNQGGGGGDTTTEYTITFDVQDGTFADASGKTVTRTTSNSKLLHAQFPAVEERAGYTWKGWYTQAGGNGTYVDASFTFEESITLYAYWTSGGSEIGGGGGNSGSLVSTNKGKQDEDHPNVYLVGKFGEMASATKDTGYLIKYSGEGQYDGAVEYTIKITLAVGDEIAVWVPDWTFLCTRVENSDAVNGYLTEVTHGDDKYLRVDKAGTYTFYFKNLWEDDKIYVEKP